MTPHPPPSALTDAAGGMGAQWCTESPCGQGGAKPHYDKLHDVCHEDEVKAIATAMQQNGMQAACDVPASVPHSPPRRSG